MDRPLAAIAVLVALLALSVEYYGARPRAIQQAEAGAAARIEGLSYQMRGSERRCTEVSKSLRGVIAQVDHLEETMARITKPASLDRDSLGRISDEAIKKKGLDVEGAPGAKGEGKDEAEGEAKGEAGGGEKKETPAAAPAADAMERLGGIEVLHKRWGEELTKAGITAEGAKKVVEALEAERQMTMDLIRKHRGDREGYAKARAELGALTDTKIKDALGAEDFAKYAKWRGAAGAAPKAAPAK